jgi:hypothetical protein
MTDSEAFQEFLRRDQRWVQTLQELRVFHSSLMGKRLGEIQWMAGSEAGPFSWLGYFWDPERFWFGYGWNNGIWRPLIEADNRSKHSEIWQSMRDQMRGTWETIPVAGGVYCRLWAQVDAEESAAGQLQWFKERSHELHEYSIS